MNSSKVDNWTTPDWLFQQLDEEFHFTLDPASSDENAKCEKHFTKEQDGLAQSWAGEVVFCNPPYCRQTEAWARKCMEEGKHAIVVALLPARPDVRWFHNYVWGCAEIRFIRGRLKFGGSKNNAPFPSMVCIWRPRA